MLNSVLEWGEAYGGPDFLWKWDVSDAAGVTPLQVRPLLVLLGFYVSAFNMFHAFLFNACSAALSIVCGFD